MGKNRKRGRGAPRFEQTEQPGQREEQPGPLRRDSEQAGPSRRDPDQPGPSRRESEPRSPWAQGQPPPRFQQQAGYQERYQSQPQDRYQSQPQERYQSQPQERYQSQPQERYQSQPQERYQSQPQERYQSQPQERYQSQPQERYQSQPQERYQSQPQERYQPQQQERYQPQQHQRVQKPSQSWGDEGEEEGDGDYNARMSGLSLEQKEEEQWGQAPRRSGRGGAWGQAQPQHYQQQQQQPPPAPQYQRPQTHPGYQQQAWPRPPQTQARLPGRPQPTQSMPLVRPGQQPVPGASGAWAKGPPQELQRVAQERHMQPTPETMQSTAERPGQHVPAGSGSQPLQEEAKKGDRPLPETQSDFMDFAPRIFASQKAGRSITVYANFFPLTLQDCNITVFHYDVVFEPDVPKSLLRRAWNKVAEMNFPKRVTVFDGMSNVYTKGPLVSGGTTFRGEVNLYHPDSCKQKEYSLMIKEVRRIPLNTLSNYREKISRTQAIDAWKKALPLAEVSVIEVILKNWPANNLIQHNRVFFPKTEMQPRTCILSDRLELRYGYFQSAFLGYKLYLNFDVAHRPFYRNDYVKSLIRDINQGKIHGDCDEANHFIKGCKIEYTLPDDRKIKMTYRANKLVGNAVSQTFEKDGETMTVADYFAIEKKYKLKTPYMPLLWVGPSSKTIYLPLELCKVADDQLYRGALNSIETRKMVSGATTDARRRKAETLQAFRDARFHENAYLKEFGIVVSKEMESVKARVLEPPKLRTNTVITVKEGTWKSRAFLQPKSFNKWCIVNLDKSIDRNCVMNLQRALQSKAKEYSMSIGEPSISPIDKGGTITYFELQKLFSNLKGMTIVIVIISDVKGLYSKVKTICETQEGILTQCIRGRTISADPRKVMTTLDNLLLKINAKLGGTNHSLNRTSSPVCLDGYVMVVGADVTHAGPGSKIPSVAAVASCCEVSAFQYGITIRVQNGEIIHDLKEIMRINLLNFNKIRKRFPEKIFFFRDGVSEGEMEKVLRTEYMAIREACEGVVCAAKITLLVVQKRHHTRFFPASSADEEGKTFNVPVGTCVDSDIVHPGGLDFYLLSHGSLLGTARPTRYRLLHDDNHLTDDELEQLTFYLCHLYSRCNRSVSYPSPTYNAHLAAFRARAYLEGLNLTDRDDLKEVQSKLKDAISSHFPMFFV